MIDCKAITEKWKQEIKEKVSQLNKTPQLCIIQVGNNQASNAYIKGKLNDCKEVGIIAQLKHFNANCSYLDVKNYIDIANRNDDVTGIIVQLPLTFSKEITNEILNTISPTKDIDALGRGKDIFTPCTPLGIMMLFDELKVDLKGKVITVLGRSELVGKPLVNLLIDAGATVISCNSHTEDIGKWTLESDVIISAVGKANLLSYHNTWEDNFIRLKQIIVDVGINRDENDKLCGDCDKKLYNFVDLITPVPNGVGRLTRCGLLFNLIKSVEIK